MEQSENEGIFASNNSKVIFSNIDQVLLLIWDRVELYLQQNEIIDIFPDDYLLLADEDGIVADKSDTNLKVSLSILLDKLIFSFRSTNHSLISSSAKTKLLHALIGILLSKVCLIIVESSVTNILLRYCSCIMW